MLYMYVFTPDTLQLRGRHRLRPGGLATVIYQVLAPTKLGLVPTANLPGPGSQTSLFSLLYVNVDALKSLDSLKRPFCRFHSPSWLQQLETKSKMFGNFYFAKSPKSYKKLCDLKMCILRLMEPHFPLISLYTDWGPRVKVDWLTAFCKIQSSRFSHFLLI